LLGASANADPKLRFDATPIVAGYITVVPTAINDHGVVIGGLGDEWPFQPFKFSDGVMESLPVSEGLALDINDRGDIIVQFYLAGSDSGYLLRGSVPIRLQTESGQPFYVSGLNNRGVVVGSVIQNFSLGSYAASWSNGVVRALSPISHDGGYSASDINDSGVAVGTMSKTPFSLVMAAMFREGQTIPLGTLTGSAGSLAKAINSHGDVLCIAYSPGLQGAKTFLVRAGGGILDIGGLPGATTVYGQGMNNLGQIVGYVEDAGGRQRAFLYMDDVMYDLTEFIKPTSGWTFLTANAINDKGQIAGIGQENGGGHTAFLLTPQKTTKHRPSL